MERLQLLFQRYLNNSISEGEYIELLQLLEKETDTDELTPVLLQLWEQNPQYHLSHTRWEGQFRALKEAQLPAKPNITRIYHKVAIAACLILLLGIGGYFFASYYKPEVKNSVSKIISNDVTSPVTNKATLTLANGKTIILENTGIGSLATEGITNANKVNEAKLVYAANATTEVAYNTLQVPRGSKPMQLQLADGSQVWLNTASSITFPNVFIGKERNVSITGEAYFEVAHNAAVPFVVKANDMKVEVLGTHFNINSYNDEACMKTTLLEGKIRINDTKVLYPGQQAQFNRSGNLKIINHVDLDAVLAWKEGNFLFENCDIYEMMRQLQRWYDIDIEYQNPHIYQHYEGVISRNVSMSKVLEMLEKTGNTTFTIKGRKVVIK